MFTTLMAGILVSIICFYSFVIKYKYTCMLYIDYVLKRHLGRNLVILIVYLLAAHHTLFTVCTSFSVKFLIRGLKLIFFFTYLYFMLLTQCGIIRECAWYCINYTVCHVNITYCGLALESMRITVNKVLNCILNSQGKFVYPFD